MSAPASRRSSSREAADKEQHRPLLRFDEEADAFEEVSLPSTSGANRADADGVLRSTHSKQLGGESDDENRRNANEPATSFEMRSRAKRPDILPALNPSFVFVDVPIEADDTLPSFAIKYHVTTAELKRINGLFHDQDFYGRQKLRVPIHKYGILAERYLPHLSRSDDDDLPASGPRSSSTHILVDLGSQNPSPLPEEGPDGEVMIQSISLRSMLNSQTREAKLFLQNMDRDLSRLTREIMDRPPVSPVSETESVTNRHRIEPLDGLGCDGADFGIPVKVLMCMVLILTIILPGAFVIYKIYCRNNPYSCPDASVHHVPANHSSANH